MTYESGQVPVVRLAPAKLNLSLAVGGRRSDGYHDLHSVVVQLALSDVLTFARAAGPTDSLRVSGHDPGAAADNLVVRALAALRRAVGSVAAPPLAVRLDKRIPVAAGLGGGSSDAAAAIDGALAAWGVELDQRRRREVAASLGADVPLFLSGPVALIEGRGERVTELRGVVGPPDIGVLLVVPAVAVPTSAVFAAFASGARPADAGASRAASAHLAAELAAGLTGRQLLDRAGILAAANDLAGATVAVLPALGPYRRALRRATHVTVGQSGSGPTLWALYPSEGAAAVAATEVRAAIVDGRLPAIGGQPPSILVTTFASQGIGSRGQEES